jgi:hypothetical protein
MMMTTYTSLIAQKVEVKNDTVYLNKKAQYLIIADTELDNPYYSLQTLDEVELISFELATVEGVGKEKYYYVTTEGVAQQMCVLKTAKPDGAYFAKEAISKGILNGDVVNTDKILTYCNAQDKLDKLAEKNEAKEAAKEAKAEQAENNREDKQNRKNEAAENRQEKKDIRINKKEDKAADKADEKNTDQLELIVDGAGSETKGEFNILPDNTISINGRVVGRISITDATVDKRKGRAIFVYDDLGKLLGNGFYLALKDEIKIRTRKGNSTDNIPFSGSSELDAANAIVNYFVELGMIK